MKRRTAHALFKFATDSTTALEALVGALSLECPEAAQEAAALKKCEDAFAGLKVSMTWLYDALEKEDLQ